jgi:hypothetical protein
MTSGGKHTSRSSSFAGYRSALNALDEVKDEVTASPPATSPTGMYERIEMADVLQVGRGDAAERASSDIGDVSAAASIKDDVTTESETGDGDSVSLPPPPPTASTVLSPDLDHAKRGGARYFTYDVTTPAASAVSSAKADVHVSATDSDSGFSLESPGRQIRAADSVQSSGAASSKDDDKRNSKDANTHF